MMNYDAIFKNIIDHTNIKYSYNWDNHKKDVAKNLMIFNIRYFLQDQLLIIFGMNFY